MHLKSTKPKKHGESSRLNRSVSCPKCKRTCASFIPGTPIPAQTLCMPCHLPLNLFETKNKIVVTVASSPTLDVPDLERTRFNPQFAFDDAKTQITTVPSFELIEDTREEEQHLSRKKNHIPMLAADLLMLESEAAEESEHQLSLSTPKIEQRNDHTPLNEKPIRKKMIPSSIIPIHKVLSHKTEQVGSERNASVLRDELSTLNIWNLYKRRQKTLYARSSEIKWFKMIAQMLQPELRSQLMSSIIVAGISKILIDILVPELGLATWCVLLSTIVVCILPLVVATAAYAFFEFDVWHRGQSIKLRDIKDYLFMSGDRIAGPLLKISIVAASTAALMWGLKFLMPQGQVVQIIAGTLLCAFGSILGFASKTKLQQWARVLRTNFR